MWNYFPRRLIRAEETANESRQSVEVYSLLGQQESLHPDLAQKCAEFSQVLHKKVDKRLLDELTMKETAEGQLVLLVDEREKPDFVDRLVAKCRDANIKTKKRSLPVGDYLWIYETASGDESVLPFVVERKAFPHDLRSSMEDGRWKSQTKKMSNLKFATTKIILLEGHQFHRNWDTASGRPGTHEIYMQDLDEVHTEAFVQGFQIQWTVHNNHSVEWLILMSKLLSTRYCQAGTSADPSAGPHFSELANLLAHQVPVRVQQCATKGVCRQSSLADVAHDIDQRVHCKSPPSPSSELEVHYVLDSYSDHGSDKTFSYSQRRDNKQSGKGNLKELWADFRSGTLSPEDLGDRIGEDRSRYLSFRTLSLWSCWQIVFGLSYPRIVKDKAEAERLEVLRRQLIQQPAMHGRTWRQPAANSPASSPRSRSQQLDVCDEVDVAMLQLPQTSGVRKISALTLDMSRDSFSIEVVVSHRFSEPKDVSLQGGSTRVLNFVLQDRTGSVAATAWGDNADSFSEQLEIGSICRLTASTKARGDSVKAISGGNYFHRILSRRDDLDNIRKDLELGLHSKWSVTGCGSNAISNSGGPRAGRAPTSTAFDSAGHAGTHTIQELSETLDRETLALNSRHWSIHGKVQRYSRRKCKGGQGEIMTLFVKDATGVVALKAWDEAIGRAPKQLGNRWKGKDVWIYAGPVVDSQLRPSIEPERYHNTAATGGTIDWAIKLEGNVELRTTPRPVPVSSAHSNVHCDAGTVKKVAVRALGSASTAGCDWYVTVHVDRVAKSSIPNRSSSPVPVLYVVLKDSTDGGDKIVLQIIGRNETLKYQTLKGGDSLRISGNDSVVKAHKNKTKSGKEFQRRCGNMDVLHKFFIDGSKRSSQSNLFRCDQCSTGDMHFTVMQPGGVPPPVSSPRAASGGGTPPATAAADVIDLASEAPMCSIDLTEEASTSVRGPWLRVSSRAGMQLCRYGMNCWHQHRTNRPCRFSHPGGRPHAIIPDSNPGNNDGSEIQQPQSTDEHNLVSCPVCMGSVLKSQINEHLDQQCIGADTATSPSNADESASAPMKFPRGVWTPPKPWAFRLKDSIWLEAWKLFSAGEDIHSIAKRRGIQVQTVVMQLLEALIQGKGLDLARLAQCCPSLHSAEKLCSPPNQAEWQALEEAAATIDGMDVMGPVCTQKGMPANRCGRLIAVDIVRKMSGASVYQNMTEDERTRAFKNVLWWTSLRRAGFRTEFEFVAAQATRFVQRTGSLSPLESPQPLCSLDSDSDRKKSPLPALDSPPGTSTKRKAIEVDSHYDDGHRAKRRSGLRTVDGLNAAKMPTPQHGNNMQFGNDKDDSLSRSRTDRTMSLPLNGGKQVIDGGSRDAVKLMQKEAAGCAEAQKALSAMRARLPSVLAQQQILKKLEETLRRALDDSDDKYRKLNLHRSVDFNHADVKSLLICAGFLRQSTNSRSQRCALDDGTRFILDRQLHRQKLTLMLKVIDQGVKKAAGADTRTGQRSGESETASSPAVVTIDLTV